MDPNKTDNSRYFVAKCRSVDALRRCVSTGKWACRERTYPPQPHEILKTAFEQGPVVLLFSVNNCHGWHGFCSMNTSPSEDKPGNSVISSSTDESAGESQCIQTVCGNDADHLNAAVETGNKGGKPVVTGTENGNNCKVSNTEGNSFRVTVPSTEKGEQCIGDTEVNKSDSPNQNRGDNKDTLIHENDAAGQQTQISTSIQASSTDTWHYFELTWKTQFITDFGEACLPSSSTQDFLLPDGTTLNKARNWQEVSAEVGQQVCHLLDNFHADLLARRQQKEEEKLAVRPAPFLQTGIDVDESEGPERYWRYVVEKVERELGRVHLACPFGSQRYNLQQPGSDIDAFIIYQAHTRDVLGFNPPKQTVKNSDREACDYTVLEVQRYCELLLAADPRCVETLFLHDSTIVQASEEWRQLQGHRQGLLTRKCLDKYLSDALGSNGVKRLARWHQENPGVSGDSPVAERIAKLVYIIVRLLQNAVDIVKGQPLCVFREEESTNQKILRRIRKADISLREVDTIIQGLQADIDAGKDTIPPDLGETKETLQNWLLSLRYIDFQNYPPS